MNNKKKNHLKCYLPTIMGVVLSIVSMFAISIGVAYASSDCVPLAGTNLCVAKTDISSYSPINTCTDTKWDSTGSNNKYCANNYWAGAKKACTDIGMRLPSKEELNMLSEYRNSIGNLSRAYYWSSTVGGGYGNDVNGTAWGQNFMSSESKGKYNYFKDYNAKVRCVKSSH